MDTLTIQVFDKDGNIKPVFQEYKFISYLINKGWLSPRHWKIPFLFGRWQTYKETQVWE
jgi:hypothetical protein